MPRGQGNRQNAQQSASGKTGGQRNRVPEGRGQGRNKGRYNDDTSGGGKQRGRRNNVR